MSLNISKIKLPAGLYIVATPIGNLKDITLRALEVLSNADVVVCEDSRVSDKLLSAYGIKKSLFVYNDNKGESSRAKILNMLSDNMSIALISDAGTPLISDPGFKLIRDAIDAGYYISSVPGASSVITALTLSGMASNRFLFEGFLSSKAVSRTEQLKELSQIDSTIVLFERSSRVASTLREIQFIFGNRQAAVVRELTKKFEEKFYGDIETIIENIEKKDNLKGEVVIVISPPELNIDVPDEDLERRIAELLETNKSKKVVLQMVDETGLSKNFIYNKVIDIKNKITDEKGN